MQWHLTLIGNVETLRSVFARYSDVRIELLSFAKREKQEGLVAKVECGPSPTELVLYERMKLARDPRHDDRMVWTDLTDPLTESWKLSPDFYYVSFLNRSFRAPSVQRRFDHPGISEIARKLFAWRSEFNLWHESFVEREDQGVEESDSDRKTREQFHEKGFAIACELQQLLGKRPRVFYLRMQFDFANNEPQLAR